MGTLHYDKAPITEAIIDIHVKPHGLTLSQLEKSLDGEDERYPIAKPLVKFHGYMEIGERTATETKQEQIGFVRKDEAEKQVSQFRLDGFTFSRLTPYESWEPFRDEAKRLWCLYRERTAPVEITRVAVRYVNRFDIPGTQIELKDYFRTSPEISPDLPQSLAGFFMRIMIPQDDLKAQLLINETIIPPPAPGLVSIVLDIDLFRDKDVPNSEAEIWSLLEQLRTRKNEVFKACITERTERLIQ